MILNRKYLEENYLKLNSVECLYLNNMNITGIDRNTFKNLTNLKQIHLYGNKINKLHRKTFEGLKKLEYLGLYGNKLTFLNKDIFKDLNSIIIIELIWNDIKNIVVYKNQAIFKSLRNPKNNLRKNLSYYTF
jgi:Leucine-rich repeat (LRR) protein